MRGVRVGQAVAPAPLIVRRVGFAEKRVPGGSRVDPDPCGRRASGAIETGPQCAIALDAPIWQGRRDGHGRHPADHRPLDGALPSAIDAAIAERVVHG
jgi:hypothetical protein